MIVVRFGRETSSVYPAGQAAVPYRAVHCLSVYSLSSICSECIQTWSSFQRLIVLKAAKAAPSPPYRLFPLEINCVADP
jgi:hypothetical protein